MARLVSLEEFVSAFSGYAENVTPESWVWEDLGLDDDELGWAIMYIASSKKWHVKSKHNFNGYLRKSHGYWLFRPVFGDLKLRELYVFIDELEPLHELS